jgi:hypothetical protein
MKNPLKTPTFQVLGTGLAMMSFGAIATMEVSEQVSYIVIQDGIPVQTREINPEDLVSSDSVFKVYFNGYTRTRVYEWNNGWVLLDDYEDVL